MRQIGFLAGAGRFALAHNIDRLESDHRRARELAERWREIAGVSISSLPATNMVYADLGCDPRDTSAVVGRLGEAGVHVLPVGPSQIRAVVHLGIVDADISQAVAALGNAFGGL